MGIRDELLIRILDAAARIKAPEDQLRRTTCDLRTRVEKCIEVDGGCFILLVLQLLTVTNNADSALTNSICIKFPKVYFPKRSHILQKFF